MIKLLVIFLSILPCAILIYQISHKNILGPSSIASAVMLIKNVPVSCWLFSGILCLSVFFLIGYILKFPLINLQKYPPRPYFILYGLGISLIILSLSLVIPLKRRVFLVSYGYQYILWKYIIGIYFQSLSIS